MCSLDPDVISHDEEVTRYIFEKRHFSTTKNRPKYPAFMPPTDYPNEISVYRILGLDEDKIWKLGVDYVEKPSSRGKPLLARGDLMVSTANQIDYAVDGDTHNVEVLPETSAHQRHANITNLPTTNKGLMKVIARRLSENSELKLI